MGNHTPGHNHESLSVCLIGGLDDTGSIDERSYTAEQWETLAYVIAMTRARWPDIVLVRRQDIQRRKGDVKRQSITLEAIAEAIKKASDYPDAKPITDVIRVRPARLRKDVIRDHSLDP
jgi:hypothetical protein